MFTGAVEFAKTTKLTSSVIFKAIEQRCGRCSMANKAKICEDVVTIMHCYSLNEPIVVFCFLKLLEENKVQDMEFVQSFEANRIGVISEYVKEYYRYEEIQRKFW